MNDYSFYVDFDSVAAESCVVDQVMPAVAAAGSGLVSGAINAPDTINSISSVIASELAGLSASEAIEAIEAINTDDIELDCDDVDDVFDGIDDVDDTYIDLDAELDQIDQVDQINAAGPAEAKIKTGIKDNPVIEFSSFSIEVPKESLIRVYQKFDSGMFQPSLELSGGSVWIISRGSLRVRLGVCDAGINASYTCSFDLIKDLKNALPCRLDFSGNTANATVLIVSKFGKLEFKVESNNRGLEYTTFDHFSGDLLSERPLIEFEIKPYLFVLGSTLKHMAKNKDGAGDHFTFYAMFDNALLIGTDAHRMRVHTFKSIDNVYLSTDKPLCIPYEIIDLICTVKSGLVKIYPKGESALLCNINDGDLVYTCAKTNISFPDYNRIIPNLECVDIKIKINKKDFIEACKIEGKRQSRKTYNPSVSMQLNESGVSLVCKGSYTNIVESSCDLTCEVDKLRADYELINDSIISFNPLLAADSAAAISGDYFYLLLVSAKDPMIFSGSPNNLDSCSLLMPVRC